MKLIYLILMSVMFSSCFKTKKNLQGRVLNPVTGEGISDVTVNFSKSGDALDYTGSYESVASVIPDASGNFELKAKTTKNLIAGVVRDTYKYYNLGWDTEDGYRNIIIANKNSNYNYHLVPYGHSNFHFKNISCASPQDSMHFRKRYQFNNDYESWSSWRVGCYDYSSSTSSELPMGTYYYQTEVIRSGVVTYVYDTLYVPDNGLGFLEILY